MAHKIKLPFVVFFFLFSLLVLNPFVTFAAVFNVSTPFELRTALFTSESNGEVDFINIAPGVYNTGGVPFEYTAAFTENFGLTITGSGIANTTLSAPNQSAVLIIDADAVLVDFSVNINIEDISIQDGNTLLFSGLAGGLTILSNTGNVMIDSCNFEDNVGDTGGGTWVDTSGQVSVSDSIFDNNTAINSNGGGALLSGNFILLTSNLFNMNGTSVASFRGGGLRAVALATNGGGPANGTIIANGNDFTNNDSTGHGGASLLADFGVELQGNNFIDNTAGVAGAAGVYIDVFNTNPGQGDENLLLTRLFSNLFQDNITSGKGGGALVLAGLDIIAVNNIFLENTADSAGGAALEAQDLTVTNNTMTLNEAVDGEGGGMFLVVESETTADIYNNIVYDNSATVAGSDIFVNDDPDLNIFGATINLVANDFSDFFSLCQATPLCNPVINDMDNIDRDPRFVDAQAGNVNLSRNSPARRAGDTDAPQLPSSDFAGNPVGDPPDMGALQFVGGGGGSGGGGGCSISNIETDTRFSAAGILFLILPLLLIMVRRIRVPG